MAGPKTRGDLALNEADHFRNADLNEAALRRTRSRVAGQRWRWSEL